MISTNIDCNELLAKIIDDKLKEEGLISASENQLVIKLAKGQLKDFDWKVAFEEILYKPKDENVSNNEYGKVMFEWGEIKNRLNL